MRSQSSTTPAVDRIRYSNGPLRSPPSRGRRVWPAVTSPTNGLPHRSRRPGAFSSLDRVGFMAGARVFWNPFVDPAVIQRVDPVGEVVASGGAHPLPSHDVHLRVKVVNVRDKQGFHGLGKNGRTELVLAVMGQNRMLQKQEGLLGEALDLACCFANQVAPHHHMTDETAFFRVSGLDWVITQLAKLADIMQNRGGDHNTLVERRIEVIVI